MAQAPFEGHFPEMKILFACALAVVLGASPVLAQSGAWGGAGLAVSTAGIGLQADFSRYAARRLLKLRLGVATPDFMATEYNEVHGVSEAAIDGPRMMAPSLWK